MRHLLLFKESSGRGRFRRMEGTDELIRMVNSQHTVETVGLGAVRLVADEVAAAFPEGWQRSDAFASHISPGTPMPDKLVNWLVGRDYNYSPESRWDALSSHEFWRVQVNMTRGVPAGGGVVSRPTDPRYRHQTIEPVMAAVRNLVRTGWSGTRSDLADRPEVGAAWLRSRRASTRGASRPLSRKNLVQDAVRVGLRNGWLAEERRGKDNLVKAGPNIDREVYAVYDFPTLELSVTFLRDDWLYLKVDTNLVARARQFVTGRYLCDDVDGLTAAVRDYLAGQVAGSA